MRRSFFALALITAVGLSACSSKEDVMDDGVTVSPARDTLSTGPLDGTEVYDGQGLDGVDQNSLAGAGTQQDLVANIGDRVFFDTDSSSIKGSAATTLARPAEWRQRSGNVNITVEGHAAERGTREYNLALGESRATAVKNYLVNLGVDPRRISTISYGKEQPAVLGSNPSAWSQNRRGVTRVD